MKRLLRSVPLFNNLSEMELEHIASICEKKGMRKGAQLFRQGEAGDTFYIIVNGAVKIYNQSDDGKEKIITVFRAGDSFGEFSIIDGEARSASAATVEDSVFLTISREAFHVLMERHFSITFKIIQQLVARLRKTNQQVMDLVFLDAKTQIIKTLITLANEHGQRSGHKIKLDLRFTDTEIAKLAGISHELTAYVIKELLTKGVLFHDGLYYHLDLSALKK